MRKLSGVFLFLIPVLLAVNSPAHAAGVLDVSQHLQLSALGGYESFKAYSSTDPAWQGGVLGGAATWAFNGPASLYALYTHGFPAKKVDGHVNEARVAANICVYPPAAQFGTINERLFIGGGGLWLGSNSIHTHMATEGHVTLARALPEIDKQKRLGAFVNYAHAFASKADEKDFDLLRAGLEWRIHP